MKTKNHLAIAAFLLMVFVSGSILPSLAPPNTTSAPPNAATTSIPALKSPTDLAEVNPSEPDTITWFAGVGMGAKPTFVETERAIADKFNQSQNRIHLNLQAAINADAKDAWAAMIAAGNGPDIIGPIGWETVHMFLGQILDLTPYIRKTGFDMTQFNPVLADSLKTEEGQISLPLAAYPSSIFYNPKLFDKYGLQYPPARYGEKYTMPDGSEVNWNWSALRDIAKLLTIDANGKNATQVGFIKNNIIEYGFTWQFEDHPNYWGSYWAGGTMLAPNGSPGDYKAQVPDAWKAAWKWTYEGMWGNQPFMANATVEGSEQFGNGNPFNSDHFAMTIQPFWYTCCMKEIKDWDVAAMPAYDGKVGGRTDQGFFIIWKGTRRPQQAFEFLAYIVTGAAHDLFLGTAYQPPTYEGIPALIRLQPAWVASMQHKFPWVKNWDIVLAGLNYPDMPSAEAYVPNFSEAWRRGNTFASLLRSQGGLNLAMEIQTYTSDLTDIFNRKPPEGAWIPPWYNRPP
jgi:multiple sugar transport system substrate-binding protein